mmetsp:Transcript_21663/g.33586  ORF Transcript_21663/g.33586 Transcript_21663/m.33586 type:complete len:264 (+) Transcript_21663:636-1427(+)
MYFCIVSNCAKFTTGPRWSPGTCAEPTACAKATPFAISTARWYTPLSTSRRVGASHDCPVFSKQRSTTCVTYSSRSSPTSAKTTAAPFPPSSRLIFLKVSAPARETAAPARVDPVKDTMSTSGWAARSSPAPPSPPPPVTRLNAPGGNPASCTIAANSSDERGAASDGFSTHVQPTASAATTLSTTWFIGQFHGVMSAATPTGSIRIVVAPISPARSNSKLSSVAKKLSMWYRPAPTWDSSAKSIGAPISVLIARAISSCLPA